ncbi:MAG: hypothetical protein CMN30_10260 [Sandaracinus sp.]|nr:hypothetical protein [Sandaracinus sp.]
MLLLGAGCSQLSDEMLTIEAGYREARYEDVVVWLDDLEPDVPAMDEPERARFFYLRGMAAHRLGDHDEALHYLALAREVAGPDGRGLREGWRAQLDETLVALTPTGATHHARSPGPETRGAERGSPAVPAETGAEDPASPGGGATDAPADPVP